MEDRIVRWSKGALKEFEKAIYFIAEDSVQNVLKVESDILSKIKSLSRNPEIYSWINLSPITMAAIGLWNFIVIVCRTKLQVK